MQGCVRLVRGHCKIFIFEAVGLTATLVLKLWCLQDMDQQSNFLLLLFLKISIFYFYLRERA